MSTRCNIGVYDTKDQDIAKPTALIYQHSDGYPGKVDGSEYGVLPDIVPFIKWFLEKRGHDAEYLAARLLQDMCNKYDEHCAEFAKDASFESPSAGILGHGICNDFHGDIEFYYAIRPGKLTVYSTGYDEPCHKWVEVETIAL